MPDQNDYGDLSHRLDQATEAIHSMARQLQSNSSDAIVSRAITRMESEMRRQLQSLVRDMLTAVINGQFGTSSNAGSGGISGLLAAMLPRFARGGVVDGASMLALGGESGPEAVLPLKRMPDGRLGVTTDTSKTGATSQHRPHITINLTASDSAATTASDLPVAVSDEMADLITRAIDDAVDSRLADHIRQGGMLNRIGSSNMGGGL